MHSAEFINKSHRGDGGIQIKAGRQQFGAVMSSYELGEPQGKESVQLSFFLSATFMASLLHSGRKSGRQQDRKRMF